MNERLLCRVKYLRLPDGADLQTELAILKVAMRMGSQGGHASYAEKVANAWRLFSTLAASTANPMIYGRGGARVKGQSGNTRAENIRWVIQNRLGKDQDTVTQYLHHGKYLPEDLLREMVAAVATKRFFEGIQAARAEIFKSLHERFLPEDEIAAQISEAVRTILADYRANNNKLRPDFIENVLAQFPVATAGAEATSSGTTSSGTTSSATTQTPAATGDNNEHQTTAVVTEIQDQPGSTDEVPTGSGEEHLSENPEDSEGTNQEDPGLDAFQLMKADVFSQLTNLGQAVNEAADLEQFKTVALDLFEFSIVLCGQFMVPDELQEALQGLVHSG